MGFLTSYSKILSLSQFGNTKHKFTRWRDFTSSFCTCVHSAVHYIKHGAAEWDVSCVPPGKRARVVPNVKIVCAQETELTFTCFALTDEYHKMRTRIS